MAHVRYVAWAKYPIAYNDRLTDISTGKTLYDPSPPATSLTSDRYTNSRPSTMSFPVISRLSDPDELLHTILRYSNDAVFLIDPAEGTILDVNPKACQMLGYDRSKLEARSIAVLHPGEPNELGAFLDDVLRNGHRWTDELCCQTRSGEVLPVEISAAPVSLEDREGIVAMVRSTAEREEFRNAFHQSKNRYISLMEQASDAVFVVEVGEHFVRVNSMASEMTGYSREELLSMGPADLITDPNLAEQPLAWHDCDSGQTLRFERQLQRKDGTAFPAEICIRMINERYVHGIVRDITERKNAQRTLVKLKRFYQTILRELPVELAVFDPQGRYQYINPEAIGDEELREWMIGKTSVDYAHYRNRDAATFEDRHDWILGVLNEERSDRMEEQIVDADGNVRHVLRIVTPVRDEDGNVVWGIGFGLDITRRKEFEQQLVAAKEEAEEMNRLKSSFLTNMSHEIRTPITSILGFTEVLAEEINPSNKQFIEIIQESGQRLLDTIESVLFLARVESRSLEINHRSINVPDHLRNVIGRFERRAGEKGLALELEAHPPRIEATIDPLIIERITADLIDNAVKFTHQGYVEVRLSADSETLSLQVEDSGIGMTRAARNDVFEAFQQGSTGHAREYVGNGLGLSIAANLVDLVGGDISLESTPGEGTTFTVQMRRYHG